MTRHFSWPYGHQYAPAWGPVTSTVNFCEIDYYITPYIAEFINTLTNVLYVYLAAYGLVKALREDKDSLFVLTYAIYAGVGIGSVLFHATLKYTMQMGLDELSMLYSTSMVLYTIWSFQLAPASRRILAAALVLTLTLLTVAHYLLGDSTPQRVVFGCQIACVFFRTVFLMRTRVDDPAALRSMKKLATVGATTFVAGFALWLVDDGACAWLRSLREWTGMPVGFVLELHGWWHLLTGTGVYCFLVFVEYLHVQINGLQDEWEYSDDGYCVMFPRVSRKSMPPVPLKKSL
ncbi:ceramidase [Morchella snyderi]|nr:ceramidase [Morchella snyderi]